MGPVPVNAQLVAGLKLPAPELVKVTVPVGVEGVPVSVSVTVAVQVVETPAGTVGGVHPTVVEVVRLVTVTVALPLLFWWGDSPASRLGSGDDPTVAAGFPAEQS